MLFSFFRFFKNNPEYQQVFPFRDVPIEELPKNKRFLAHANGVVYGFSSIVDAVDDPEMLGPILSRIGESHAPRRIDEKSFTVSTNLNIFYLYYFISKYNYRIITRNAINDDIKNILHIKLKVSIKIISSNHFLKCELSF